MASIDVEALYSSIHHNLDIHAIMYFLRSRGTFFEDHNQLIVSIQKCMLTYNYFLFDHTFFHQLRGTAIGSASAPTYANLLLGWWKSTNIFDAEESIWSPQILFWVQYIDDIFLLWAGSENDFDQFMICLNNNEIGLRFTSEINKTFINI